MSFLYALIYLLLSVLKLVPMTLLVLAVVSIVPTCINCLFYMLHAVARTVERRKCLPSFPQNCFLLNWFPLKCVHSLTDPLVGLLDSLAYLTAQVIYLYSQLFHSYEVVGLDNIPTDRAALLIYYHGVLPTDMMYLPNQMFLRKGRVIRGIADRFLFWVPFWGTLVQNYIFPGPAEKCVGTLQRGHLLQISPGGTREALFATRRYETVWNNRAGFARVAKEAKVDIIPIFTRNIRQLFILPEVLQRLFRPVYENYKFPYIPLLGIFPVKLVTYVGEPIRHDSVDTAEELAELTKRAIETMITTHQPFPARISTAVRERFSKKVHFE